MILFECFHRANESSESKVADIPYKKCVLIGLFQALAMIPGVSRSGATILGGLWLGLERKTVVEFSFLLAVPTMFAATALDLLKSGAAFSAGQFHLLLTGGIASFIVALASIRFLLGFIQKRGFIPFGVYRILAALAYRFLI